jgi:hypothetical protein
VTAQAYDSILTRGRTTLALDLKRPVGEKAARA